MKQEQASKQTKSLKDDKNTDINDSTGNNTMLADKKKKPFHVYVGGQELF